jgi:hypothetical protein
MELIHTNFYLGEQELLIRIAKLNNEHISLIIDVPPGYNSPFTDFLNKMGDFWIGKLMMSWDFPDVPNGDTGAFLHSFYINPCVSWLNDYRQLIGIRSFYVASVL